MKIKLKKIATVQTGYSFRTRLEISQTGHIAVIQMKDLLEDNTVSQNNLAKIDIKNLKKHHFAQKNDLIFRSRGLVSTAAILQDNINNAVVAAPLIKISVTKQDKILPEYLNWYLTQKEAQMFFTSQAKGTVQKMISKEVLEELEISLPSVEKQKQILELATLLAREQTLLNTLTCKREYYISTILAQIAKGK